MKILLVGGIFDDVGGRPSGYVNKLYNGLVALSAPVHCVNGGEYNQLKYMVEGGIKNYDVVIWFADVPNGMEKLAHKIKQGNPKCILVTSKRNEYVKDGKHEYPFQAVVAHALRLKSNLIVQFHHVTLAYYETKIPKGNRAIFARVFDPLGNCYTPYESANIDPIEDPQQLARILLARIRDLTKFTRIKSVRVGPAIEVPNQEEFFKITKAYADRFHELLDPQQTDRFLGNASFRCDKGFPSFREGNLIFVSRRNIDKRHIGPESFVAVNADCTDTVSYYGDHKPSVDTPIQLRLYRYFSKINYMLHGHVYLVGGMEVEPPTPIPCGAIEEVDHITRFSRDRVHLAVNLLNHGCLLLGAGTGDLDYTVFEKRPAPEAVKVY